jgi:TadE-like protein
VNIRSTNRKAKPFVARFARQARPGQAAVEFALVAVVLMALLYGILEISRLLLVSAELTNAAREGVHYAALHPCPDLQPPPPQDPCSSDSIKTLAIIPKLTLINPAELTVSQPYYRSGIGPFFPVKVTVSYTWTSWVNIMPDMSAHTLRPLGPIHMQASSVQLIEGR